MRPSFALALAAPLAILAAAPSRAATPRELLTTASFQTTDRAQALGLVNQALTQANAMLVGAPNDREGRLQSALAIGYRSRLTKSPADARASRKLFEAMVAGNPRDAEFQLALGGWHLDAVAAGYLARTVLGARADLGLAGLDRAVALGGDRAFFKGMAALMRVRLDAGDPVARQLAEQAAAAPTPTALDRIARADAQALLGPLRSGDGAGAQKLARALLPFGKLR